MNRRAIELLETQILTNQSELGNEMIQEMQSAFFLMQMSESELLRLLNGIAAIGTTLENFSSVDDKLAVIGTESKSTWLMDDDLVKVVSATHNLLNQLNDETERIRAIKQAKDTCSDLENWDNEGGRIERTLHGF